MPKLKFDQKRTIPLKIIKDLPGVAQWIEC